MPTNAASILANLASPGPLLAVPLQSDAFSTGSPAYAAVRWLWFLASIGLIGAIAFRFVVLPNARSLSPGIRADATARAARVGLVCAAFTLAAAGLRLVAQAIALLGELGPDVVVLITGTSWGTAWVIHAAAATAALAAFLLAWRAVPGAWALAAISVPALAAAPALAGHAAAVQSLQPIPILADTIHVAAAGGWVGGLLVLLTAGLPAARDSATPGDAAATLVGAFSPLALICAALIIATGAFASLTHLQAVGDLVATDWGRLLALKLVTVAAMIAFGARNFLRLKPALHRPDGPEQLRRSAAAELAVGAILLLVTAFLVAVAPPSESHDMTMDDAPAAGAAPPATGTIGR